MTTSALIVVDYQNDFAHPDGSLFVANRPEDLGERILAEISSGSYARVFATKDWHIAPGEHFEEWPMHCVSDTWGSSLAEPLTDDHFDLVFHKGHYEAAYSGFEGADGTGASLHSWLADIERVVVCGLALDYCVKATALDAAQHGYETVLRTDLTAAVADDASEALDELVSAGVLFESLRAST